MSRTRSRHCRLVEIFIESGACMYTLTPVCCFTSGHGSDEGGVGRLAADVRRVLCYCGVLSQKDLSTRSANVRARLMRRHILILACMLHASRCMSSSLTRSACAAGTPSCAIHASDTRARRSRYMCPRLRAQSMHMYVFMHACMLLTPARAGAGICAATLHSQAVFQVCLHVHACF